MKQNLQNELNNPLEYFYHWEKTTPNKIFLRQPFGNTWKTLTYSEAGIEARKIVTALKEKGLTKGDHIGILSKNCYHWILADIAISMGGFVSVPFYSSLPKAQLNEVVIKSDIKLLFVGKLDSWGDKEEALPKELKIIKFPHYNGNAEITVGESWTDLTKIHSPSKDNYMPELSDLWTILFTSGTTGSPKGVMLSFKSIAVIFKDEKTYNTLGIHNLKEHCFFSFLPLNHVAERIAVEGAAIFTGGNISFAESIDTFVNNLQDVQPNIFFAVPRIWSKFQSGVFAKLPQKKLDKLLKIPILSSIIKNKIRKALGLGKVEIVLTGAALTPDHLKIWYRKLGINIREVFGMTEACGAVTLSPIGDVSNSNVGKPIPGTTVRIKEESKEILYNSEQTMMGYYKEPEKTAEILIDGWINSGDKGYIDENNYLKVIGRVKDAFKTQKGIYITPNPIESNISKNDLIEQTCVVGFNIPQPIVLINLSETGVATDNKTTENNLKTMLTMINEPLANYQKLSTIVITKETWSEENDLLTPTLKVKRNKIDELYMDKYPSWHNNKSAIIWET